MVLALSLVEALAAGEAPVAPPVSVPVKSIRRDSAAGSAGAAMSPATDLPTLPDARLPQYQFGHERRALPTSEELGDPRVRFLLALPTQPLLIEATLKIDGEPFRMARERRVAKVMAALASGASAQSPEAAEPSESAESNSEGAPDDPPAAPDDAGDSTAEVPAPAPDAAVEQVRRYFAATQAPADPEEVRWLLSEWIDGPVLLLLQDHFQRARGGQRPAFDVLDRDRDGVVAGDELDQAVQAFEECDLNRDDIVSFLEVEQCARDPRRTDVARHSAGRLITLLPAAGADSARVLTQRLTDRNRAVNGPAASPLGRFDADGSGGIDEGELSRLLARPADLSMTIEFHSDRPDESSFTLTAFNPDVIDEISVTESTPQWLTLFSDGVEVQIWGVQGQVRDQVSLGAVEDGYPLLPELDPSGDDRLTIRERRELQRRLLAFDRDDDGRIDSSEARAPVRLCIGLGPVVDGELAVLRQPASSTRPTAPPGPDWFVRMDRNRDNDLSRGEFPGTDVQFAELDADGDGLVATQEATEFTRRTQPQTGAASSTDQSPPTDPDE